MVGAGGLWCVCVLRTVVRCWLTSVKGPLHYSDGAGETGWREGDSMSDGLEDARLYGVIMARDAFVRTVETMKAGPSRVAALEAMVGALADELETARARFADERMARMAL